MFQTLLAFLWENKIAIATVIYETAARAFPTKKDITLTNVIKVAGSIAVNLIDTLVPNKAVDNETHS
jgi:hypothetical protein